MFPERVKTPEPTLVSAPSIPLITPAIVVDVASPKVIVFEPKATVVPDTLLSEPMVSECSSVITTPVALRSTETLSARASPFLSRRLPASTDRDPVNVFVPDSINSPAPIFTTATLFAVPFCIVPLKIVDESSEPTVNTNAPVALLRTGPDPAIEANP